MKLQSTTPCAYGYVCIPDTMPDSEASSSSSCRAQPSDSDGEAWVVYKTFIELKAGVPVQLGIEGFKRDTSKPFISQTGALCARARVYPCKHVRILRVL